MPRVDVVRRDYRVITPALKNLQFAGPAIAMECAHYDSYKLEKREPVPLIGKICFPLKLFMCTSCCRVCNIPPYWTPFFDSLSSVLIKVLPFIFMSSTSRGRGHIDLPLYV
jgi:hypothetical protein